MRSLKVICFLGLAALGWAPISRAAPQPKPPDPKLESAMVNWRWIGIRRHGVPCPEFPGWESKNWLEEVLSEPGYPNQQDYFYAKERLESKVLKDMPHDPLLYKLDLDRFCSYNYLPGSSLHPRFPPQRLAGLADVEPARLALVPAGTLDDQTWGALADHFRTQTIGAKKGTASLTAWRVPFTSSQRVRLVFIDTQEDGNDVPTVSGPSRHGFTLAHMAKQLICRDAGDSCPVTVATRLALPHPRFDAEDPAQSLASRQGGYLGLVDELAGAIVREVEQWRQAGSKEKLILNLSVGWDVELLDQIDGRKVSQLDAYRVSQLEPSAQLVYKALRFARRSGALVIAAAGNHRGGRPSGWPVLPAAWELRRPTWFHFPFGRKPVYAVGGVDWQGLPLPNARLGGMPRRVAFGDHAVANVWQTRNERTEMYTGSSVSTAVASSIAAVVWQLRPELTPAQVMRLISRSGDPLPGQADYYAWRDLWPFSHMAPSMRKLSLCSAVARACRQGDGKPCEIVCPSRNDKAADLSMLASLAGVDPVSPLAGAEAALPPDCRQASDPEPRLFALERRSGAAAFNPVSRIFNPAGACPLFVLPAMVSQRWVAPEPDDPPCLSCTMIPPRENALLAEEVEDKGDYILAIEIAPEWRLMAKLISASLDVNRYSEGQFVGRTTYTIQKDELADLSGEFLPGLLRFSIKGDGAPLEDCTAALDLAVSVGGVTYSVQSPVYVDPR